MSTSGPDRRGALRLPLTALVLSALAAVLGGCSHTFFQFHVNNAERNEIVQARNALVASQGNPNGMAQVVDVNGRRAVETLLAGMTVESTAADPQYQRLVRTLYLGVMPDGDDPLGALDSDIALIAARVGQRVATNTLDQMGLGGIAAMVGMATDNTPQRLAEMQASLARSGLGTCGELHPIISYDAGILGHIRSQLAERDAVYVDWRSRVRAIHLVRWGCPRGHVLMVLAKNANEPDVRVIGWHNVTPPQWVAMEPRLRQSLDLPPQ
jgi:hypothetical protein